MENISVELGKGRFSYRVGAIIIKNKKILMVRNNKSPHYYSVGGRVKIGESSIEALNREIKEELGLKLNILDLAVVQESFYEYGVDKDKIHEISLFYNVDFNENTKIESMNFLEVDCTEYLQWLDLNKLDEYEIYPEFFKREVLKKNKTNHFIDKCY